jgi:Fe-S cluster assembly protein SufD
LLDVSSVREKLQAKLEISASDSDAKFLLANLALAQPVALRVPKNTAGVEIDLRHRWTGDVAAPLTLVLVESGAEVILHDRVETDAKAITGRAEIIVEQNAKLTYVQDEETPSGCFHYRSARIHAHRDSRVNWTCFTTGAQWHAARLGVIVHEPGVEAHLYGLFSGDVDARADHRTQQHHGAPNAMSNLLFKNLLAGRSHSVYQGVITVPQIAQKTDAYQTCRNLMLDQGTHAHAMPKLEIVADDVKCSHGASIGSLNKEQLFYLQTRGLSRREAMTAIASGFAEEIIQTIPLEHVRDLWRRQVSATISRASGE